ncbi:retrotransposon protein, putative, ty1-copia subclass [Tanacetum coccineum]
MHGMGKTVNEFHAMLKLHEQTQPKQNAPTLHVIRAGKVQKKKNKQKPQFCTWGKNQRKGTDKCAYHPKPKISPPLKKKNPAKDSICHQYGDTGYWKMNCPQNLAELLKNMKLSQGASSSGIFTIELYNFPNKSWVYDTGCGTHICNITQGLRRSRKLKPGALSLTLSRNNMVYFSAARRDGIIEIDLSNPNPIDSSMYSIINKRAKLNLDSALLWHCHLGHISKKRIKKLQYDGLLNSTDLKAFEKCVPCMSGKMARKPYTHQVERAKDLLGLIHTDHKHEVFKTFKVFQKEIENQLGKTIKSLRSDRGGEYMSQEFLDHLKDHKIIAHRTPPYTPQHNEVSERRNRTLLDMVQSMMSQTTLPKSFWDYALETATHILNMVPTKMVEKTPYEVWHGQAPKLSYLKVWGCEVLVKRDTLTKPNKLEPRPIKYIFLGYPKETMGYSFYYPPENKVLVDRNTEFLENSLITQEAKDNLEIDEPQSDIILIRRSTRTRHALDRMCLCIDAEEHELGDLGEPANYKAVLLDPESDKWLNAMNVEMQSMKDNEVWDLVDLLSNGKTVGSKWLFKKKTDMDGAIHTYKARLVAKGYTQTPRIDYEEKISPVADIRAIRILIAIVAFYDYEIWQMDVKTAFLNGYLSKEVYMEQPEDQDQEMNTTVVNNSLFRSLFEKQKLTGNNFMEWYRNLRIVLSTEDKLPFLEQPISTLLVPPEGQAKPLDVVTTYQAWVKAQKEIAGLMLMTMDPAIQKNLEHLGAYDMLKELKTLYVQQAYQDLLQTLHEQTVPPKEVAPALHAIRAGRIQKNQKKKSHKAAKGNQGKGKAKMGYAPVQAPPFYPKPKNPPTSKKDNPAKDAICHQCGEVGHWRINWLIYLSELMKKKKLSQGASTSGSHTHICITTQGLRGSRKLKPGALSLAKLNLDSALLWHCRLGHINKKRIEKLQHDGLLDLTDIKCFEKYVACMSGKMARNPYSHQVERAKDQLGLIHTDVCGPFKIMSRQGAYYFITFTDDFSRYDYVYLLKHKHEMFETFKVFKKEVENQLGKTIKSLRSNREGKYMSQEFLDHLKEHGIIAYRTPPYTPQLNGDYALESAARILNTVPTKKVDKTPYEVWHGQAPKLSYLKVWDCEALVKRDTLTKPDKLEPKALSLYL